MRKSILLLALVPALVVVTRDVESISSGIFPNSTVTVGTSNVKVGSLTRASGNSCGGPPSSSGCHRTTPFLTKIDVAVGQRVLNKGASTSVTVTGVNTGVKGTRGGFCADVTSGTLIGGTNAVANAAGNAISHKNAYATGRQWRFGYKAGTTPGLVEFYTVVNCVDGDGRASAADQWALYSGKLLATQTTPIRLFVNADGVKFSGSGCPDAYGNHSVLGCPTAPTVGNQSFRLEAHGLPPSSQFMIMMSVGGNVPGFDMKPMGAPGCVLRTLLSIQAFGPTSAGDAVRGEGKVILPAAIPNDQNLKGLVFSVQIMALDQNSTQFFPMVVTNGLEITIS